MTISRKFLMKGAAWTIGSYGVGQLVRFAGNVALSRLLAPELFGIMLIVNSLTTGAALVSDLGLGQNIVQNRNAEDPEFYNTAWTLQVIRGFLLWAMCTAAAIPLSHFYGSSSLLIIMPVVAFGFSVQGFTSVGYYMLQKRLLLVSISLFDIAMGIISTSISVLFALITPTVWALVFGALAGNAAYAYFSYFLVRELREKFFISRKYLKEILHFGGWIFVSSIVYFFSTNLDRLFLAKTIPLEFLGVYGIARSISELLGSLVIRLASIIMFPLVASLSHLPRAELRQKLASTRLLFLIPAALGFSLFAAVADLLINLVYDQRYHAAGWMMPILISGVWIATLCNLNESTLLGLGRPSFAAAANGLKFGYLAFALPLSFSTYGALGCVVAIATGDIFRYVPVLVGQRRESLSFGLQDGLATFLMVGTLCGIEWARWRLGFRTRSWAEDTSLR